MGPDIVEASQVMLIPQGGTVHRSTLMVVPNQVGTNFVRLPTFLPTKREPGMFHLHLYNILQRGSPECFIILC